MGESAPSATDRLAGRCPACGDLDPGVATCRRCGLDLSAPQIARIRGLEGEIRSLLAEVRAAASAPTPEEAAPEPSVGADAWGVGPMPPARRATDPTVPAPAAAGAPPGPPGLYPPPTTAPVPPGPRRTGQPAAHGSGLSAGSLILIVGALLLGVAALVFLSVTWSVLGAGGRTLVLIVLTAASAAGAVATARRSLRASTETLWALTCVLLTIDLLVGRAVGVLGLEAISGLGITAGWTVLTLGLAAVASLAGRGRLSSAPVAPQIATTVAAFIFAMTLTVETARAEVWVSAALMAGAVVPLAAGLVLRATDQPVGWRGGAGAAAFLFSGAALVALVEAVTHPSARELAGEGRGVPVLVVAGLLAAVALVPFRRADQQAAEWIPRAPLLAAALVLTVLLVTLPLSVDPGQGAMAAGAGVASLLLVALASLTRDGQATLVSRAALTAGAVVGLGAAVGWAPAGLAGSRWVFEPPTLAAVLVAGVSLAAATAVAARHPMTPPELPPVLPEVSWLLLGVTAVLGANVSDLSRPEFASTATAIATLHLIGSHRLPRGWFGGSTDGPLRLSPALEVAAVAFLAVLPWAGWPQTEDVPDSRFAIAHTAVIGALLLGSSLLVRWVALREVAAGLGTLWLAMALGLQLDRFDLEAARALPIAATFGLVVGVVAVLRRDRHPGVGLDIAGALIVGVIALAGTAALTPGEYSFLLTVIGAGATLTSFIPTGPAATQPRWRWRARLSRVVGAVALGLAWVVRLVGWEVGVPEAYTGPFALILLIAGVLTLRRQPELRTWSALSPGLALAIGPSLLAVLDDPLSWRAVLLGFGATVALGTGAWRRWQAPFVAGAVTLIALAIIEIAPYAVAIERWILLGGLGLALLAIGITWEDRLRDGRAVRRAIAELR